MDIRFENGAVMQVVGPSGCGKTLFVSKILNNADVIFKDKIGTIYWLTGGGGETSLTEQSLSKLHNLKLVHGFPKNWINLPKGGDVMVIDDLFEEANSEKNFNNLFTKIARHRQVFVIFITQNLFHQGGKHRTRNINVHYLVLFKNPRDQTVIDHVARQAFPNNKKFLIDAYHDATVGKPFGYILIDFTQQCVDDVRVRSNIFDEQNGITVYKQHTP